MTDIPVLAPLQQEAEKPKGPPPIAKCGLCKALLYADTKGCGVKQVREKGAEPPISCPLKGDEWKALLARKQ